MFPSMAIYSTQFAEGTQSAPNEVIYTVPSGFTIVVKAIDTHDSSGDSAAVVGTTGNPYLLGVTNVPGDPTTFYSQWRGYQVFNDGQDLILNSNTGGVNYIVSGYLLINTP